MKSIKNLESIHVQERINKIFQHFGYETQHLKLVEECQEFLYEPFDKSEIADVFVVSAALAFNDPEIRGNVMHKIKRTEERIKSGYYE